MHLPGTNLDFNRLTRTINHLGMQTLVPIWLRIADVIVEQTHNWRKHVMNIPKHNIAISHRLNYDANRNEIEDILELNSLFDHLVKN